MLNVSPRGAVLALAFALAASLAVGCGKKDSPQPGSGGEPSNPEIKDPLVGLGKTPDNENPEVLAYLKGKGWKLYTDMRISDGKRQVYLTVEDKNKPYEKVAISNDDYKMIAKSKALQVLDLRNVECTDDGLKAVAGIPQMEGIIVFGEETTDAGLKALAQSKSLDYVSLFGTKKVTDAGVKELAAMPKLQTLYLAYFTLDGSAFEAFAGSKSLNSITLEFMDGLTDDGAKHLAKVPDLKELVIKSGFGEKKLTSAGIKSIVATRVPAKFQFDMKLLDDDLLAALVAKNWYPVSVSSGEKAPTKPEEVKYLSLDDSSVTDKGFAVLLNCTNAKSLHLQKTGITDETLKKLGAFKQLDYLALEKTKVTAAGLEAVAGLPIKHLAMQGCTLTEDSFKAFGKMTALEELWLSDAKMKADWLKHIAKLPKLKDLNLMSADFDDAAVKHVATMPELKSLTLNNTSLGDAGFQELIKLPKLESLHVDSTKVTKDVYQKAKKDRPKLSLYFYRFDN
jgi:internalin A